MRTQSNSRSTKSQARAASSPFTLPAKSILDLADELAEHTAELRLAEYQAFESSTARERAKHVARFEPLQRKINAVRGEIAAQMRDGHASIAAA